MQAEARALKRTKSAALRASSFVFFILLLASAVFAGDAVRYPELRNFHKVNDHLYRGGQPRKGGIQRLAELGVRTIVNLRREDESTLAQRAAATAAGIRYYVVSMPAFSRPAEEQISRVMSIVDASENWPVFIHCDRGSDRTGVIVAIYHMSHDGWTHQQALSEAKKCGMSPFEFGMKHYLSEYYIGHQQNPSSDPASRQKTQR